MLVSQQTSHQVCHLIIVLKNECAQADLEEHLWFLPQINRSQGISVSLAVFVVTIFFLLPQSLVVGLHFHLLLEQLHHHSYVVILHRE
jgi:hypothetical protein